MKNVRPIDFGPQMYTGPKKKSPNFEKSYKISGTDDSDRKLGVLESKPIAFRLRICGMFAMNGLINLYE